MPNQLPPIPVGIGAEIPDALRPAIAYTLGEISVRLGRTLVIGDESAPISYGGNTASLPFNPSCWSRTGNFEATVTERPLWTETGREPDLIGGVFRLLTLADENAVTKRDKRGIFTVDALPQSRRDTLAVPLVENHVAELADRLHAKGLGPAFSPPPYWPGSRSLAVVVTHDIDATDFSAPAEIAYNAIKRLVRGSRPHGQLVFHALDGIGRHTNNPYFWAFSDWRRTMRDRDRRSAFYIFHRSRVRRVLNDCRSTLFNRRTDWSVLRAMADEGFEFGAQPSIRAKESLDEFIEIKAAIEDRMERPIYGLRHHYWALDWQEPHKTWRKHVNAGFRYDASMAWRDAPGFRAGTSLPYRPWDPERGKSLDLYILPTAIMDGHVLPADPVEAKRKALDVIPQLGGTLVLDWHAETAHNEHVYDHYRTAAEMIMDAIPNAWTPTPWELVKHWHQRRMSLAA